MTARTTTPAASEVSAAAYDRLLDEVLASFEHTPDPRARQVLQALVRHAHAFLREVRPSLSEWAYAVDFLTRTGQQCSDTRQEFVLLSDVLGLSMLTESINDSDIEAVTDSTVLGPFHMTKSPARALGDSIDMMGTGTPCLITGTVTSAAGRPLAHASVDVWQCDENGLYDVQAPDRIPAGHGRGLFRTDADGRFAFRTIVPSHYPIPTDGPVGELLKTADRHPYRPAHIHFIAAAPGHRDLTTHIFIQGSPYLDSDAVFAVKESLVTELVESQDPELATRHGLIVPFHHGTIDLVLAPAIPEVSRHAEESDRAG
ncbi:dioxygenase [Streptomyces sp. NPDC005483]|uniref:dioxygenase family protein n=1 Tax=Streptomyces sp. NPDC005483 TaxID=3154882 RepID=UPI0033AB4D12